MRVVCICEDEASVNSLVSGIRDVYEIPLIIVPDFDVNKRKPKFNSAIYRKVIRKAFFTVTKRRPDRDRIKNLINRDFCAESGKEEKHISMAAGRINSEEVAELVREQEPDFLFVCGAPILKPEIFEIPKYGSINFHFGYSPRYKGQHCILWPYLNSDFDNIAGTFLRIDRGVDTGQPISFVFPEISGADSYEMIEAKVADLGRKTIAEVLEKAKRTDQRSVERIDDVTIRYADYGIRVHLKYLVSLGLNRLTKGKTVLREQQIEHLC